MEFYLTLKKNKIVIAKLEMIILHKRRQIQKEICCMFPLYTYKTHIYIFTSKIIIDLTDNYV